MTAKRTMAAKTLPAWTRRFGSIALLDFIPRIWVVIRSKDPRLMLFESISCKLCLVAGEGARM